MTNLYLSALKTIISRYPAVIPHLRGRARWTAFAYAPRKQLTHFLDDSTRELFYGTIRAMEKYIMRGILMHSSQEQKTYDYFLQQIERLIRSVYNGNLGGEFIDIMANLISGQLNQAFQQAWSDEGTDEPMPDYLTSAAEDMILGQYDFVDGLYKDIVDARVDETGIEALLSRAPLWANRWNEAYNQAINLILSESGGRLIWKLGQTEQHCSTCSQLDGIVALATEWDALHVHPQGAPNGMLECGGWQCDCSLEPTDQRRSPKAFDSIMNIVQKG